jgi:heme-degrading monooxygenase HmoA
LSSTHLRVRIAFDHTVRPRRAGPGADDYPPLVILRVLSARVPNANIGAFNELLRAQLVELRTQPGLVYSKLARRLDDDGSEEVVLVEEWRTSADLLEWTRGRLNQPRLLPGTEDLIEELVITHYEALDVSPEDLSQRLLGAESPPGRDPTT